MWGHYANKFRGVYFGFCAEKSLIKKVFDTTANIKGIKYFQTTLDRRKYLLNFKEFTESELNL